GVGGSGGHGGGGGVEDGLHAPLWQRGGGGVGRGEVVGVGWSGRVFRRRGGFGEPVEVCEQDGDVFVAGWQADFGEAVVERDDLQAGSGADPVGAVAGAAEGPDDGLELGGRGAVGVVQQQLLELGGGDAGDRADLGVGQGAGGESGADLRQLAQ